MSLEVRKAKSLIEADKFLFKGLVYALPGVGKTDWSSGAPDPGYVACETGVGAGLLTIAEKDLDFIMPTSISEFEAVCVGNVFKTKQTIVLDSLSDMCRTFIKDFAISMPRKQGSSPKRNAGVPELDDYGVMGEITRRLLRRLLEQPKHIIVLATERYDKPDAEIPGSDLLIGPDLPGQMFLGSTAMFDFVFRMRTRPVLRDHKDPKSRYSERYFITDQTGPTIAKCRSVLGGKALLPNEIRIDRQTGEGSFSDILGRLKKAYSEVK